MENSSFFVCTLLGDRFPERTQDGTIVFTMFFLVTDTIQVRSITNSIVSFQSGSALNYIKQAYKIVPARIKVRKQL